jgi:hypothetical protein
MWKEAVKDYFEALFRQMPGRTDETTICFLMTGYENLRPLREGSY